MLHNKKSKAMHRNIPSNENELQMGERELTMWIVNSIYAALEEWFSRNEKRARKTELKRETSVYHFKYYK